MSLPAAPMSCTPSGSPSRPVPYGTLMHGTPSSVQVRLKSELPVLSRPSGASPDAQGMRMLEQAISRLGFSARAYHRVLRVARTCADMAEARNISAVHVAEAIQYRRFDRS